MQRGEREIQAAAVEQQKAATRNAHKGDWRREPLGKLWEKLREEEIEFYEAVLAGDAARIREELGDLGWCATMIASHGYHLAPPEDPEPLHAKFTAINGEEALQLMDQVRQALEELDSKSVHIRDDSTPLSELLKRYVKPMLEAIPNTIERITREHPEPASQPIDSEEQAEPTTVREMAERLAESTGGQVAPDGRSIRYTFSVPAERANEIYGAKVGIDETPLLDRLNKIDEEVEEYQEQIDALERQVEKLQTQLVEDAAVYQERIAELEAQGAAANDLIDTQSVERALRPSEAKGAYQVRYPIGSRVRITRDQNQPVGTVEDARVYDEGRLVIYSVDMGAHLRIVREDYLAPIPGAEPDPIQEPEMLSHGRYWVSFDGEPAKPHKLDDKGQLRPEASSPRYKYGDEVRLATDSRLTAGEVIGVHKANGAVRYSVRFRDMTMREIPEDWLECAPTIHRATFRVPEDSSSEPLRGDGQDNRQQAYP